MSRLNEREIARKLAERDELEPPAGLLDRIKSEIPPSVRIGTEAPGAERRNPLPSTRRWLIAASLVATVGAGFFALRLGEEAPSLERPALPVPTTAAPALPAPQAPMEAGEAKRPQAPPPAPKPAPPPPAAKTLKRAERDLGSPRDAGPGSASPRVERDIEGGAVGGVEGGVVGGVPGRAQAGTAEPPFAPAAVPSPPPPPPPAPAAPPDFNETITVQAESPLLDERRVSTGATVSQSELEKVPTARDPWAILQTTPGVLTDRINVGGNESGQQSNYVGLGKTAGNLLSTFVIALDTGSCAAARRALAAGRLPAPGSVRVAEFVSAFDGGAPMRKLMLAPARKDVVIQAEGAPTPFVQGPRYRLLRFNLRGRAARFKDARVEVELNPEVVERYRMLGEENRAAAGERGVTVLYEVELRADLPPQGRVATLRLRNPAGMSEGIEGALDLSGLAPSWEKASPGFRLTVLAAELAEILKGSAAKGSLAEIAREAREIGRQLPKSAGATDLADLAEKAARIKGE